MVKIYLAHTTAINPPESSPTLTRAQIWAGLQLKVRQPQAFVPVIESCEVVSDEGGVVTREVRFKAGMGPGKDGVREVVRGCGDVWVDFEQDDGMHIWNVVSVGGEGELFLTYMYEFDIPGIKEEGGEAEEKERERLKGMAKKSVESSIAVIRDMVKDGRITA